MDSFDQDVEEEFVYDNDFPSPTALLKQSEMPENFSEDGWMPALHRHVSEPTLELTAWETGVIGWLRVASGCNLNRFVVVQTDRRVTTIRHAQPPSLPDAEGGLSSSVGEIAVPTRVEIITHTNYSEFIQFFAFNWKLRPESSGWLGQFLISSVIRSRNALLQPFVMPTEFSEETDSNNLGLEVYKFCDQFYWSLGKYGHNKTIVSTVNHSDVGGPLLVPEVSASEAQAITEAISCAYVWYVAKELTSEALWMFGSAVNRLLSYALATPSEDSIIGSLSVSSDRRWQTSLVLLWLCFVLLFLIVVVRFRYRKYTQVLDSVLTARKKSARNGRTSAYKAKFGKRN